MAEVTIRELRNRGGDVIRRVSAGERLTVTLAGRPVAELRPLRQVGPSAAELLRRWRSLPPLDLARMRRDADSVLDTEL